MVSPRLLATCPLCAVLLWLGTVSKAANAATGDELPALRASSAGEAVAVDRAIVPADRGLYDAPRFGAAAGTRNAAPNLGDRPVTLIELPPEGQPGNGRRAHHALGFRSSAAENWLRTQGIGARTCYLPMLRMPARISSSSGPSVALWVYARCTFD